MDFREVQRLVADDMEGVNAVIRRYLHSDIALINQIINYIISSGGKRMRPLLALLCARACGYEGDKHLLVAAITEFIHTATLLHDDVVDNSSMRRGQETANLIWGNESSILVGDFIFSRSFEMMVEVGTMRVMEILAHASNTIAEGEVMQLMNSHDPDSTEEHYMLVIQSKTAKLFEAACQLGAVLSGQPQKVEEACTKYGMHIGTAFQLKDDVLDYQSSPEEMGKNLGEDLTEGRPTLPLIHALRKSNKDKAELIRDAIIHGGKRHMREVMAAIHDTGAIAHTLETARKHARSARLHLEMLPDNEYRSALEGLTEFAISRTS
ncbi:MAG: polyprenyl synthetase family protein [Gammaproteobacteria bacterium]|nr:polyprenyl synthetase family protein [Gammaproteobacteria bacterium]